MNKKVILVIMDGIGLGPNLPSNAIAQARTPYLDELIARYPHASLNASGRHVGLPEGQMGNSEVGHLNIGAGRVVYTGLSLINKDLEDNKFYENKAFLDAINHAKSNNSKIHIMGLCSNGGVHSSLSHILALIDLCNKNGVSPILHAFSDGRDVDPKTFINDLQVLISKLNACNGKLATISGRYYAMDRDQRWERTTSAYDAILCKQANNFTDPVKYVNESYTNGITDEFIHPGINKTHQTEEICLSDNDAVIFANFRPDRARQLSHVIFGSSYYEFQPETRKNNLFFVTMMNYEGIKPSEVAYPPQIIRNTLGEVLANNNIKQLRIAETEKYAHVTFFFDGGIEINYPNETKILVNSPKVATYDLQPEMSAIEVTDKLLNAMDNNDVVIVNYANGDMVGHTGNLDATITAVETVDAQIGRILTKAKISNYTLFIIADHGNADVMTDEKGRPITKHTTNKVPLIITDESIRISNDNGSLCNVAPSILKYLDITIPSEMAGEPIIEKK